MLTGIYREEVFRLQPQPPSLLKEPDRNISWNETSGPAPVLGVGPAVNSRSITPRHFSNRVNAAANVDNCFRRL